MGKLNIVDLEILYLGIKNEGVFDEKNIEQSELKKLGVGRILDQLASLKERNLIDMNKNGSFSVTNSAKTLLWNDQIPLWIKILRVLEIKSQDIQNLSMFLLVPQDQIQTEIYDLRKRQLVLMSPLRKESGIVKMYEILPEGIEQIKKVTPGSSQNKPDIIKPQIEVWSIIEEIAEEIKGLQGISDQKKEKIISKILKIKERLEI